MSLTREQAARLVAVQRRYGLEPPAREQLTQFNEAQSDWYGVCKRCGASRRGTLAELRRPCPGCGK